MKKLLSWFILTAKSILPLEFRLWLGPFLLEYVDLFRFYILKDKSKVESTTVPKGYIHFLECMEIGGITFQKVNPIMRESILISFKPYIKRNDGKSVFFTESKEMKLLTLTSRSWEKLERNTRDVMDAREFLLTASYFLKFPLDEMEQSAMEAIASSYRSIVIIDTNSLSRKLCDYLSENFKGESLQIIQEGIKYRRFGTCKLDLEKKPDVVITLELPLLQRKFLLANGEPLFHLPFFYLLCGDATRYFGYQFEQDIINNILPKLVEKNVQILIFSNPQEGWMASLPFRHTEQAYIELAKRELEEADYRYFGENVNIRNVIGGRMVLRNHCLVFDDRDAQDIHWKDGERLTIGNNGQEKQNLYFFGPCFVWGNMCSDDKTIESYIRYMLGEQSSYAVHNYGCTWEWIPWMMRNKVYRPGDIVIIFAFNSKLYRRSGWNVIDISPAYRALGNDVIQNCWDQSFHINYRMNESIAKLVYENIQTIEINNGRGR